MHRPEEAIGWRSDIDIDGHLVQVHANHHRHNRMPRGHEIARQAMRGRQPALVEEVTLEWRVWGDGVGRCVVRPNPNGTFQVDGRHSSQRDLIAAVSAWARQKLNLNEAPTTLKM